MNRKSLRISLQIALLAMVSLTTLMGAFAQGFPGGMPGANMRVTIVSLLQRFEVQRHISLDLKQRIKIDELLQGSQGELQQKMRTAMQNGGGVNRNATPQERQAQMQTMQETMTSTMTAYNEGQDEKIKKLLRPNQWARLQELLLQRKGPQGLTETKIQDEMKLSNPTRAEITKVNAESRGKQAEIMQQGMQSLQAAGGGRAQRGNMQALMAPTLKKVAEEQKALDAKILESLTDDERVAWTKAQGEPFKFRPDPVN
ncbi:MAG: hypothetical protein ABJA67_14540 [Chthonomonadales bacterium]